MNEMTPIQMRILDELMGFAKRGDPPEFPVRPSFDASLSDRLLSEIEEQVLPRLPRKPDRPLWVGKYQLDRVHRCEGRYIAATQFEWTAEMMRGRVAHRAIEASIVHGMRDASPLELIDDALTRLASGEEGDDVAAFVKALPDLDIARLKAEANDAVCSFLEDFPPIKPEWNPRVERKARVKLCDGQLVLGANYDFIIGRPQGMQARSIIIDFKTGSHNPGHSEDLRFYALLETLRCGVPPFRVATYYLEESRFQVEDVNVDVLNAAVRRLCDGVERMMRAKQGNAVLSPGKHCRFCPVRATCDEGRAYLAKELAEA
ncbi:MAG: PD-(D/E)XK nuclease family protein [Actinomycetota bacterium]